MPYVIGAACIDCGACEPVLGNPGGAASARVLGVDTELIAKWEKNG